MILYNLFLLLYTTGIRLAALFNPKAALWVNGRKNIIPKIQSALSKNEQRIWIHCASLGEFEQGRPVIEALRQQYPDYKIVLTFFSPSGYEIRKDYDGADYVFYLPMDGKRNAKAFLDAVNPSLILFVKYEFWYYYLYEAKRRNIPTILISAAFRQEQAFFKWYGGFFRKILASFNHILVQDAQSKQLLAGIGFDKQVAIAGDTRYDRVLQIAGAVKQLPEIEAFKANHQIIIGGSTWPEDEKILQSLLKDLSIDWKMILAPHEIDEAHIAQIQTLFGDDAVLFSDFKQKPTTERRVLIIDNIGMLSSLYRYGDIAFVGGGFNKGGIHNVLEPAVFGLPVLIGPVYEKFVEAVALVKEGLVFPVRDETDARQVLNNLTGDDQQRDRLREELKQFTRSHAGATKMIMKVAGRLLDN